MTFFKIMFLLEIYFFCFLFVAKNAIKYKFVKQILMHSEKCLRLIWKSLPLKKTVCRTR